jgi:hypothetical protein
LTVLNSIKKPSKKVMQEFADKLENMINVRHKKIISPYK